ncbi:ATP-dependent RecD-like DNA helicase [compost metagenome]
MMRLDDAIKRCKKYVGDISITDIDPQLFAVFTLNDEQWIQRTFIHSIISTLSRSIAGIAKTKPKETYPSFTDDGLDSSQLTAVNMAMSQQISIITGGPGTGKTYVVKKVVSAMNLGDSDVLLLALAGKSAQRLSDSTGIPASTIHSALQLSNNNRLEQAKHMLSNVKLVVIDEVSTIGILVFYRLIMSLSLLDPLPKIVLLGDSNQLESIEMGSVLQSLIDGGVGYARLEVDHRTSNGFRDLVEGCLDGVLNLKDPAIQTITAANPQALLDLVSVYAGRIPALYNIDLIHRYQLLAPTYSGQLGIDSLNLVCQQALNANPFFESPSQFKPGDKVQLTQNTSLYKNGEIGQITSCQNGFLKIQLPNRIVIARPEDVELAYVLSVHKFIGSEADVIVYISEFLTPFERDVSQTYTMATRAKLALYIMTTTDETTVKLIRSNERQCNFSIILRSAICE